MVGKRNFREAVFMCVFRLVLRNHLEDSLGVLARVRDYNKESTDFIGVGESKRISSSHSCAVSVITVGVGALPHTVVHG